MGGGSTPHHLEGVLVSMSLLWLAHETGLREIMTIEVKDFSRDGLPGGQALTLL